MEFRKVDHKDFTLIEFQIPGGVLDHADLRMMTLPTVPSYLGVVISGRGPVWLFSYLTHQYHFASWVGCYDPRLAGAVVVLRHWDSAPLLGEVVPVSES